MNKVMERKLANKVVSMAIEISKMPNQVCFFAFGKPKAQYDLTLDDYSDLANLVKDKIN